MRQRVENDKDRDVQGYVTATWVALEWRISSTWFIYYDTNDGFSLYDEEQYDHESPNFTIEDLEWLRGLAQKEMAEVAKKIKIV